MVRVFSYGLLKGGGGTLKPATGYRHFRVPSLDEGIYFMS